MKNVFKKGLILGGLLAAAAAMGFSMNHEGKQLTEELQKELRTLAKQLKKNLHRMHDVTEENFDELATTIVEEYSKKKALANDEKEALIAALQAKWHEMEEEYLSDQEEVETEK